MATTIPAATCGVTTPNVSVDLVAVAFFVMAWYYQFSMSSGRERRWYEEGRKRIPGPTPPGWLFGVMWLILYTLLGVSTYLYFRNYCASGLYTATLWLVLGNMLVNKLWSLMFFDWGGLWVVAAFWLLLLVILPTAILVPVFMGIDTAWLPFGLWLAYPVWLLVAAYLNLMWVRLRLPTNDIDGDGDGDGSAPVASAMKKPFLPQSPATGATLRQDIMGEARKRYAASKSTLCLVPDDSATAVADGDDAPFDIFGAGTEYKND